MGSQQRSQQQRSGCNGHGAKARKKNTGEVSIMDSERNGGNGNMKTDNALLEQMLSDTNLGLAFTQVKRNKSASGADGSR